MRNYLPHRPAATPVQLICATPAATEVLPRAVLDDVLVDRSSDVPSALSFVKKEHVEAQLDTLRLSYSLTTCPPVNRERRKA